MQRTKIVIRKKQLKSNGDIVIDSFYFPRNKWSMLIPNVVREFDRLLDRVIIGTSWKNITNKNVTINVNRLERESMDVSKDMIIHYQYFTNSNGKICNEKDIRIKESIDPIVIDKLSGLTMICLHGLGKEIYAYLFII